ncbi:MAG: hypothetical protein LBI64_08615 [Coriobacteriales bacterium]|nr:hypothetical protein [Coriobacteriales bacterium]
MTSDTSHNWGFSGFMPNVDGSVDGDIDGVTDFNGGRFGRLSIDGIATSKGAITADKLTVAGVFTCKDSITAGHLECSGVATIEGDLKAKNCVIDGVVNVIGSRIEADEVRCNGVLSIRGQISADVIRADGFINASEIVGDSISIHSRRSSFFFQLWLKLKETVGAHDRSEVDLIEATTIDLRGVKAREVNGHDVTIGEKCEIERVSATGRLIIDPSAKIGSAESR